MVSCPAFCLARRLLIVRGGIEMRKLTWKPILANLRAALGEIDGTYLRLYFLDLGELPDDCPRSGDASYIDLLKRQEERNPLDEMTLFISFEHAYHHLNFAWNCRRTPEERVWRCADNDFSRWIRFPDTAVFADLWPQNREVKGRMGQLRGKVSLMPTRIFLQMARRKLNILCYLVAKELGGDWARPKGLYPEIGAQPLTEKDFARRMHRVYVELNMAWNSRKDKTFATNKCAIARRRLFPPIFATGCHNMWRKKMKL
jgi:hypothetical protein